MKKSLLILFLICMLGSLVFAGGQSETDGVVELRYMMWDPQIIEKEEALAAEFHQQFPNVKVTVEAAAFAQFWQKMQAMAAAKTMPDVFWMSSGYVKDYARLGAIRKLDDFVSNYDPDYFFEKSFNVLRAPNFQGDLYAFPWAVVTNISYYNIRMFDEAGLAYPTDDWTFDDLRSLAKKLSKDTDGDGAYDVWGYHVKAAIHICSHSCITTAPNLPTQRSKILGSPRELVSRP
jgi:multiple sugar transport system substrate-binding protein